MSLIMVLYNTEHWEWKDLVILNNRNSCQEYPSSCGICMAVLVCMFWPLLHWTTVACTYMHVQQNYTASNRHARISQHLHIYTTNCTKHTLLGGGRVNEKNVDSIHFQHFSPFLSFPWQIIHLKNVDVYTFWGGRGVWESMFCTLI